MKRLRRYLRSVQKIKKRKKRIFVGFLFAVFVGAAVTVYVFRPVSDPFHHDAKVCRIDEYGASKTDAKKTREAFVQAFSACGGGGTVVVPMGTWVTGGITIPSDTTLYLNLFSTLSFSDEPNLYLPAVATRWEGMDVMNYQPLVYVPNAKKVAVLGHGTFRGNGEKWWDWKNRSFGWKEREAAKKLYEFSKEGISIENRMFGNENFPLRPSLFQLYESENVIVDGVTFTDGPMWTVHAVYSKEVTIRHITVDTTGLNTDGVAVDSSENVTIEGCRVGSGDDAIVIKSGLDYDGWRQNRPSKNIVIRDTSVFRGNAGVTIGSEMSGGVENVMVQNMKFSNVDTGIRMKTMKGRGGYIRNIRYEDIVMRGLAEGAVQFDLDYKYATLKSSSDEIPETENITLSDIRSYASNGDALRIGGTREVSMRNVSMENCIFFSKDSGNIGNVFQLRLENVSIFSRNRKPISMKNVDHVSLLGYFPRGGFGGAFVNLKASSTDISSRLFPCPKDSCVSRSK